MFKSPVCPEILKHSKSVCWVHFDNDGKVTDSNDGFDLLFNGKVDLEKAIDKIANPSFRELLTLESSGIVFDGYSTVAIENEEYLSLPGKCFRSEQGMIFYAEHDVSILTNVNRQMLSLNQELMEVRRALTKEKKSLAKALAELKNAQEDLINKEKMASLGRMVAGFAHELNTPIGVALTAVSSINNSKKSLLDLLKSDEVEEDDLIRIIDDFSESADLTHRNLHRAGRLVDSFKRTAIDRTSGIERSYDLNEIIRDTLETLSSEFRQTNIKIQHHSTQDVVQNFGFPGALTQILTNLLLNSKKYAFENGTKLGKIDMTVVEKDNNICLSFKDNGLGMNEETRAHIFEPFYTTGRSSGGTGLGMFVVFNLVRDELWGEIECQSSPNAGATFIINFPVRKP